MIRTLYVALRNRAEMERLFRAALREALCPGAPDDSEIKDLASEIEPRLWQPGAIEPPYDTPKSRASGALRPDGG